jgi:hypothetical protein
MDGTTTGIFKGTVWGCAVGSTGIGVVDEAGSDVGDGVGS